MHVGDPPKEEPSPTASACGRTLHACKNSEYTEDFLLFSFQATYSTASGRNMP